MSEYFKTLSGTWNIEEDESFIGTIDTSETARTIAGSETEQDYELYAIVEINAGKASLIVNFTYTEDWEEQYLELILDPTNEKVTLEAVIRNADGTEKSRTTLASRNMTIEANKEYKVRLKSSEIESGVFAVYGYINKFMVAEAEDLATAFQKGMHGFECLGSDKQYSSFSNIVYIQKPTTYGNWDNVKQRLGIDITDYTHEQKIKEALLYANAFIDAMVATVSGTIPSTVPDTIKRGAEDLALFHWYRNITPTTATLYYNTGYEIVNNWIKANYGQSVAEAVGANE